MDALLPPQMAARAEQVRLSKARLDTIGRFVLAVLARAFIGFGALFSTTTLAGSSAGLLYGVGRLVAGVTFSLGLILVIVEGAELFTGNTLIVMAWASGRVSIRCPGDDQRPAARERQLIRVRSMLSHIGWQAEWQRPPRAVPDVR